MGTLSLTSNWPDADCRISVGGVSYSEDVSLSLPNGTYTVTPNFVYGFVQLPPKTVVLTDAGVAVDFIWAVDEALLTAVDTRIYANVPSVMICQDGELRRLS